MLPTNITLREGNSGEHVMALQQRLAKYTLLEPEQINGFFDNYTLSAVRSFQNSAGLQPDGIVAEKTIRALNGSTNNDSSDASFTSDNNNNEKEEMVASSVLGMEEDSELISYENSPTPHRDEPILHEPSEEAQKDMQQQMRTEKFTWEKEDAYEAVVNQESEVQQAGTAAAVPPANPFAQASQSAEATVAPTEASVAAPPANPFAGNKDTVATQDAAIKQEIMEQGAIDNAIQSPAPPANPFAQASQPTEAAIANQATEQQANPAAVPTATDALQTKAETATISVPTEAVILNPQQLASLRSEIEPRLTPQAKVETKEAGTQLVRNGAKESVVPADVAELDTPAQGVGQTKQAEMAIG